MMWTLLAMQAAPEVAEHGEALAPVPFYLDPAFWVGVGFVLFIALLAYLKVHKGAAKALDERAARIAAELDEAASLRRQAEVLLDDAKARRASAAGEAETILAHARDEAAELVAKAETSVAAMIERRTRMAEEQIASIERAAVDDLRARAAELATDAATRIIAEHTDEKTRAKLTDQAIGELDRRLN
jgi:F-type H+-transporting ATPase subunit b